MPWRTAHASEAGTSHAADAIPCQDFHLVEEIGDYLIVAVADGAGSARLSGLGARTACTWAVQHLKTACDNGILDPHAATVAMRAAFDAAQDEVHQAAALEHAPARDLSSTLLVALVGPSCAAFGQIGDGAAVYDAGDGLVLTHWPEQETINLTDFLTSAPLATTLTVTVVSHRVDRLALMTDGLTHLLLDFRARRPHRPAFERLLGACSSSPDPAALNDDLRRFLNSGAVNERSDDDKTLVLAVRAPEVPL